MHPPTCWTKVGALLRPFAPWWCSGQKLAANVEKLLPVLCVGRGLVVHVSESCSGRVRVPGCTCRGPRSPYTHFCPTSGWVHPLFSIALFLLSYDTVQRGTLFNGFRQILVQLSMTAAAETFTHLGGRRSPCVVCRPSSPAVCAVRHNRFQTRARMISTCR